MDYNLEYWLKYMNEDSNRRFNVEKNMLKVLLVNQNGDDAFFNYFNFENRNEIVSFLKLVILPSTILSNALSEYEEVTQITLDYTAFMKFVASIDEVDDKCIKKYQKLYSELDELSKEEVGIKALVEITEDMNYIFGSQNDTFLIVEFSDCLKTYLSDIYEGYKKVNDDFETLNERLSETDFTLEDFISLVNDTNSMKQDDLEEFLYQIPII